MTARGPASISPQNLHVSPHRQCTSLRLGVLVKLVLLTNIFLLSIGVLLLLAAELLPLEPRPP